MPAPTWNETFRIRAYETDPSGAASVPTICNLLQESASNHARALGVSVEQLTAQNVTWVLARLHVEMDAYPTWRETVHVETWPSGIEGLYATREFVVTGGAGEPLGRGTSAWLLIDVDRRRPVRIPEAITAIRRPARGRVLADAFEKLPAPATVDHTFTVQVRYGDLDLNRHANNVHYLAWALEALPRPILEDYRLTSLEVHFRAETADGDVVASQVGRAGADEPVFHHRLVREADGREVVLARTRWTPRTP